MAIRAAFVLAALVLASGAHAQSVCVLEMDISGSASISGQIKSPVTAPLNGGGAGFSGKVNLVFPQGSCPTKDNVNSALGSAYLAPNGNGVTVSNTQAYVGSSKDNALATVNINNLKAAVSSKAGLKSPVVVATDGVVKTTAPIQVADVYMKGRALNVNGNACKAPYASGSGVTIECPSMQMTNSYTTESGAADLTLSGNMKGYGDLSKAKLVSASSVPKP